jgi:hypothetical protein
MNSVPSEVKDFIDQFNDLLRSHKMRINFDNGTLIYRNFDQGMLEDNFNRVSLVDDSSELYESKELPEDDS